MPALLKEIRNKTNLKYYYKNRSKILPKVRKTSKERYARDKKLMLERTKKSIEQNYEKAIYRNVKARCKKYKIDFNIKLEDIKIPELCPYLKIPLTRTQGKGRVWTNASIDRVDPTKGYISGNVQIISAKANVMKLNANKEELIQFALSILEIHS